VREAIAEGLAALSELLLPLPEANPPSERGRLRAAALDRD